MTYKIVESEGRYLVFITTKSGRRYRNEWANEPTGAEVLEAWKNSRRNFVHIN